MNVNVQTKAGNGITAKRDLPLTIEDAMSAVGELDGDRTSIVELERDDHYLWIAGGPDRFTVTYSTPGLEKSYSLILNPEARGTEPRVIGGSLIDQPVRELVGREAAEEAAAEFVETGTVRLTSDWEDQDEADPATQLW